MDPKASPTNSNAAGIPPALDDEASRYARGVERLLEAVCDLASARTLEEIADIVRHAARDLSQADGATFVLRDSGNCYYMDEDAIAPLWRGLRFPLETCISGWAMLNKQGVSIPDIYADDRIPHEAYRPTFVKSLTMSPIRTADPIGAIGSYWADHHDATPTERRLLQALADSTAVALESVRTMTDLEDRVAERTIQLATANHDLQQFASRAAHDLREPLATMTGFSQALRTRLPDADDTTVQILDGLDRTGRRLIGLIDELLTFARAGSREVEAEDVDLDHLVHDILRDLDAQIEASGAEVTVDLLGGVCADPTLLRQALQNLLVNALTYVRENTVPRIRVEATRSGRLVRISVIDNGPGVSPDERERIMHPFARGSAADGVGGTGLGLAICKRVAEHHGGTITADEAPGGGAVFALTLPEQPDQD